jgi:hypothetical protein
MMRFALPVVALLAVGCSPSKPADAPRPAASSSLYNDPAPPPKAQASTDDAKRELENLLSAQIRITGVMAQALRVGAAVWQVSNQGCPSARDLVAAHVVPEAVRERDAWETPFRVSCDGKSPMVTSAGPDRAFGTGDDIVVGGN